MGSRAKSSSSRLPDALARMLATPGVSGGEAAIAALLAGFCREAGARVEIDAIGNVVATKGRAPRRAVLAHMDTVGFMVKARDGERLVLAPVGGVQPAGAQPGLLVADGHAPAGGLILSTPDASPVFEPSDPAVAGSAPIGARVCYAPHHVLEGGTLTGPNLDDRLGCWVALEALRASPEVVVVFTVDEEVGSSGAYHCRRALEEVEQVLLVDVTYAAGHGHPYPIELGQGPALTLKDSLMMPEAGLRGVREAAARAGIPLQLEVVETGGSDAVAFARSDRPLPFAFLGIPSRHNHRPYEVVRWRDVEAAAAVVRDWASTKSSGRRGNP